MELVHLIENKELRIKNKECTCIHFKILVIQSLNNLIVVNIVMHERHWLSQVVCIFYVYRLDTLSVYHMKKVFFSVIYYIFIPLRPCVKYAYLRIDFITISIFFRYFYFVLIVHDSPYGKRVRQ